MAQSVDLRTPSSRVPPQKLRSMRLRRFAQYFIAGFVPLGGLVAVLVLLDMHGARESLQRAQRHRVQFQRESIGGGFRPVVADLLILSESKWLRSLLEDPDDPTRRTALADEFRIFSQRKGMYDQIRYLDNNGQEIVRVNLHNGTAAIVANSELRSKHDRYYFTETMRFGMGEVFISPFDLNVENGKIEEPFKPTIRFATPIFDAQFNRKGIVILNYLGDTLLKNLTRGGSNAVGETWLLNSDGYWLYNPNEHDMWGFMLPDRQAASLARSNPELWTSIIGAPAGQIYTSDGLFTYEVVHPAAEIEKAASATTRTDAAHDVAQSYFWVIMSRIPHAALAARHEEVINSFLIFETAVLVVLTVICWFYARATVEHELANTRLLQTTRLAAIGEAMAGLAHESRNALQRSQSGLELLVRRVADRPEALHLIQQVQAAQQYLYDLYETVRGYAAPRELQRQDTDLCQLAHDIWQQVLSERTQLGATLLCDRAGIDTTCTVDQQAIGQVLRNLFDNALSASPTEARIQVAWSDTMLGTKKAIVMTVRDNGPGLSAEEKQRIFEPFFTTKVHGTGLGMAISKRIVESHGGRIEVGDTAPVGAELIVTLPRRAS